MKKCFFSLSLIIISALTTLLHAQIFSVGTVGITIKSGTIISGNGLILTPSADITMANVSLIKNTTISNPAVNPYITRVYKFSSTTAPFSGTVQINYSDPGELNSIPEADLELNVYDGIQWRPFSGTVNATNDYVLSNPINNVALNELTPASRLTPLPLQWLSFSASKQNTNVLLKWTTDNEQNTKSFTVQWGSDGQGWTDLTTLVRSNANSNTHDYNYLHKTPTNGINYYRILQSDLDGRSSYSSLQTVKFTKYAESFYLLENPVYNHTLRLQVTEELSFSLFTTDGKFILKKQVNAGLQQIDVSRLPAGMYLLKGNNNIIKIVLQ